MRAESREGVRPVRSLRWYALRGEVPPTADGGIETEPMLVITYYVPLRQVKGSDRGMHSAMDFIMKDASRRIDGWRRAR